MIVDNDFLKISKNFIEFTDHVKEGWSIERLADWFNVGEEAVIHHISKYPSYMNLSLDIGQKIGREKVYELSNIYWWVGEKDEFLGWWD